MRRLRLLFALFAIALLAPVALLVQRAVSSAALEREMRHRVVAERVFDEMERSLTRFLEHETEISSPGIEAEERDEFPFLDSRLDVEPSRPVVVGQAREGEELDGPSTGQKAGPARKEPFAGREALDDYRRSAGERGFTAPGRADETQKPGSTLYLSNDERAVAAPKEQEMDGASPYAVLRSLNKAVEERVARQRLAEPKAERLKLADEVGSDKDAAAAAAGAFAAAPPSAAPAPAAEPPEPLAAANGPLPLAGRVVDPGRVLLYRPVVRDGRMLRRAVVLSLPRLETWLKAQALGNSTLAANAQLAFSTPFAQGRALADGTAFLFRHRFAEPFAELSAELALRPLPGVGSATYVYVLSALLIATGVLGLAALYRMVAVVVAFAERRSNFVAAVTHELKTPLTAIRMYGEMLRDGMVPSQEKREQYYRHITVESERLSRLINNVLEFSRLEKGNREMTLVCGDVAAVLREAADLLGAHVREQGFALAVEIEPRLPPVRFERDALVQVLFNLVDNAVKYARGAADRRVVLAARRDGGAVRIAVRDSGPGVPSHHLGKIFEAFYRGENELTRRNKGTGLGLALVRGLVERMGGRVRARNRPAGGFEVEIELVAGD